MGYSKGKVKFNNVRIGDLAWIEVTYSGNVSMKIIPRALGVRLRSTIENGGGYNSIMVRAWVVKNSRKEFEDYVTSLQSSLGSSSYTLTSDGTSYSNCYINRISMEPGYTKFGFFNVEIVQSI